MYLDLAETLSGNEIAASDLDGRVTVWSTADLRRVASFQTTIDPIGMRLALIHHDRRLRVVVGSWDRREVTAYDVPSGDRVWTTSGLQRVQQVSPARDGSAVAVAFDRGPIQVLDSSTGQRIAGIRGGRAFWQSAEGPVAAVMQASRVAVVDVRDWSVAWTAPISGFAILSSSFSPDGILVSDTVDLHDAPADAGAAVSAFSLAGKLLWTYRHDRETNVPWLGWDSQAGEWVGVEHTVTKQQSATLLRWSQEGFVVGQTLVSNRPPYVFAAGGRLLACSNGRLLDTGTGREVGRLE
jgi:outer membrane protein assembly factor BamB